MFLNKLTSHHRLGTLRLQYCKIGQTIRAIGAGCHRTGPASILDGGSFFETDRDWTKSFSVTACGWGAGCNDGNVLLGSAAKGCC